jgi:hypothetical protein
MTPERMYEIAAEMRSRAWSRQSDMLNGWEPDGTIPQGDPEWYWYLQGKAEAYAAVMSELETSGAVAVR